MPSIRISKDHEPLTLDDLRQHPGRLYGPSDLRRLGVFNSYDPIKRAVKAGTLAAPYRLPNGRPCWEGRAILALLNVPVEAERTQEAGMEQPAAADAA